MSDQTMSNVHLITIAIANLGGHEKYVDAEDIALQVNELAPGKFNWRKYPEFIDIQVVNQALQDARRDRNGGLVVGTSSRGWMLSKSGMEWIKDATTQDGESYANLVSFRRGSLLLSQQQELNRLKESNAYKLFVDGARDVISRNDFYNFAKINEYFPHNARQRRFSFIESTIAGEEEMEELWRFLQDKFAREFE